VNQFPIGQLIFFLLTPVSHIGASLFLAKPRFGKAVTCGIWLLYAAVLMLLPSSAPTLNFFLALALHMVLFFVTTKGGACEKGFLFFSYATIYTFFSLLFTVMNTRLHSEWLKAAVALFIMALMQVLLYAVMFPAFRKVASYLQAGWPKFYAVVLSFFALIIAQAVFPIMDTMTGKEIIIFALTALAFCITYITLFASMKSMVELAREKRRQLHAELLLSQVQAQAKEAIVVRQNRHDMRHHYEQLLVYANNGDLEKITAYLQHQTQRIENLTSGRFCENETVNNILRVYSQKAADENIAIQITAAAKPDLSAAAPDLVAIIANILENALHGAVHSGSPEPFIDVRIRHKAQRFVISCANSCLASLQFDDMPDELRGIGIQSITASADQYGGSCQFCAKDGVFRCTVIMDE